ncbi:MAG: alkaline phosphatase PhoX [Myxococcota bacterium]
MAVPRRRFVGGGLAALAAAFMQNCGDDAGGENDAGDAADAVRETATDPTPTPEDTGVMEAAVDAGDAVFRRRDIEAAPPLRSLIADIGPLGPADERGIRLPEGFTARIIATSGQMVEGTSYEWPVFPDGAATFRTEDGGWILTVNSEIPIIGGVSSLRFAPNGDLVEAYSLLQRTSMNCAGGPTPWHTWLSCEEIDKGRVFECDPWGEQTSVLRPALGVFRHEAVTVDTDRGHLYLTEDVGDGAFYRFVPDGLNEAGFLNLARGQLEVAVVDASNRVSWVTVPDPQFEGEVATRYQVEGSAVFNGGEGIWYHDDRVYFSTKGDNRVWSYNAMTSALSVLYDAAEQAEPPPLRGVDNITVSCCGDVLVAEDGGEMRIVSILPSGELIPLVQIEGQDESEITGPAFDPSGTRLYFNSQRGVDGNGFTYEITGPFHEPA